MTGKYRSCKISYKSEDSESEDRELSNNYKNNSVISRLLDEKLSKGIAVD